MEYLLVFIVFGLLAVIWFVRGLTNDRRREFEREREELTGVIDVRREAKDRLRTDDKYRNKLHDKYND